MKYKRGERLQDYSTYTAEDYSDKSNYDIYRYFSDMNISADEVSDRTIAAYERAKALGVNVLLTYQTYADPLLKQRRFIDSWTVGDSLELLADDIFQRLMGLDPLDRPQVLVLLRKQAKAFGCTKEFDMKLKAVENAVNGKVKTYPQQKYTNSERRSYAVQKCLKCNEAVLNRLFELDPMRYHYSDRGTSDLFSDMFRHELRFCTTAKEWYYYDDKVWKIDSGGMVAHKRAKELFDALMYYSVSIEDEDTGNIFRSYYGKFGSKNKRDVIVKDAADCCHISAEQFDSDPALLNCQNGTFDLRTMKLRPHSSEDMLTKISNVTYDENARSEDWEKFICEVMPQDKDKVRYFQKAVGYSIGGDCTLETCFILYGATTRNGKSTAVGTIAHMLGDYARTAAPEVLAAKKHKDSRNASEDIARLAGCRFLNISEPPQSMAFDSALLKTLTGRDTVTARFLFQGSFEFVPQFTIFINTNYLPKVLDETLFTSERINVIDFDRHFEEYEQDKNLKDRLKSPENISGLFNWCMSGLKMYRQEGLKRPHSVGIATAQYAAQSDKLGNFIDECLEESRGNNCTAKEAYEVYRQWCTNSGYFAEGKQKFFDLLRTKNLLRPTATIEGKTVRNVIANYIIGVQ